MLRSRSDNETHEEQPEMPKLFRNISDGITTKINKAKNDINKMFMMMSLSKNVNTSTSNNDNIFFDQTDDLLLPLDHNWYVDRQ